MRTEIGRRHVLRALGPALLLAAGGCAYRGTYYDDGVAVDVYYDGYYDGFYGPYVGGYWANDGFFYYWLRDRYHRDDERHFRRKPFPGGRPFRGDRDGPSRRPPPRDGRRPPRDGHRPPPDHN